MGVVPWTPGRGVSYESALEREVEVLRHVVNVLDDMLGPRASYGWMKHSPADEAFRRAIGADNGSSQEGT
jgi:hypothetical protein